MVWELNRSLPTKKPSWSAEGPHPLVQSEALSSFGKAQLPVPRLYQANAVLTEVCGEVLCVAVDSLFSPIGIQDPKDYGTTGRTL